MRPQACLGPTAVQSPVLYHRKNQTLHPRHYLLLEVRMMMMMSFTNCMEDIVLAHGLRHTYYGEPKLKEEKHQE